MVVRMIVGIQESRLGHMLSGLCGIWARCSKAVG